MGGADRISEVSYEIETRAVFEDHHEAFDRLPFLKECLKSEISWKTWMYGSDLFKSDRMLRFSEVLWNGEKRFFIGFKEKDIGRYCNIREEIDEEVTEGLKESIIMQRLGIGLENFVKKDGILTSSEIPRLFEKKGYGLIFEFHGHSLVGDSHEFDMSFKLMYCRELKYPLLLELEKVASSIQTAYEYEKEIMSIMEKWGLKSRMIREEPTALFPVQF